LLVAMPMLDDIDIALVQRANQSRGVVILGAGDLVGVADGRGRGGGLAGGHGGVPVGGNYSDISEGGRGNILAGGQGGGPAPAPDKGKDK
jgi:hypothetical protein